MKTTATNCKEDNPGKKRRKVTRKEVKNWNRSPEGLWDFHPRKYSKLNWTALNSLICTAFHCGDGMDQKTSRDSFQPTLACFTQHPHTWGRKKASRSWLLGYMGVQLSCKDKQECIGCQSKADQLKLGLRGAKPQINEGNIQFSFFLFSFFKVQHSEKSLVLQYVTLHFNAFPPPDGLDKTY